MATKPEVILSVNDWYNLLAALQTVIDRYGLEEVESAVEHIKTISSVSLSGRCRR